MSRGIMEEVNNVKTAHARMDTGMKGNINENFDAEIKPEEDETVGGFEE